MEPAWAWQVLGVPPGTGSDDVRRAFRRSAQLLHPDRVSELGADVRAEAHRRMVELAEAYRVCSALAVGLPPPPPRAHDQGGSTDLRAAGDQAATLLATARAGLATAHTWAECRRVVTALEQIADAWPGTTEGDAARVLLVTSSAAANALSSRERAGHLVLVVDDVARDEAWDSLTGRDELVVAQVVHAHPTAPEALRRKARQRLAALDDWATLAGDDDPDVRRTARAQLLLQEARALAERARWLERRERAAFDRDLAQWRATVAELTVPGALRDRLAQADLTISTARS